MFPRADLMFLVMQHCCVQPRDAAAGAEVVGLILAPVCSAGTCLSVGMRWMLGSPSHPPDGCEETPGAEPQTWKPPRCWDVIVIQPPSLTQILPGCSEPAETTVKL